jgi:hypothetical protein
MANYSNLIFPTLFTKDTYFLSLYISPESEVLEKLNIVEKYFIDMCKFVSARI